MQRVVVIGWDCSDFRLISPWIKDGYLPNLESLIKNSKHGRLRSINPPVTPIAWSTIVTGRNPGKHGISGFMSFRSKSYETYPVNASDRRGKDVWELLSDYGKKVAVVGVPMTFPVRRVNGCMISGFLTPNESVEYCYPRELKEEILSNIPGYAVTPANFSRNFSDFSSKRNDEDSVKSVFGVLQKHIDALLYLAEKKDWDFLMGVFNETDWVQHRFWSCIDKNHPRYDRKRAQKYEDVIRNVHIRLDEALGQLLKLVRDANLMLISDHGVGPLYRNINVNCLLHRMGKLHFKRSPLASTRYILARLGFSASQLVTVMRKLQLPVGTDETMELKQDVNEETLVSRRKRRFTSTDIAKKIAKLFVLSNADVDWSRSTAFARMGHGEIFLNRENFFPEGIVKESEYTRVRSELIDQLRKVEDRNSSEVMEQVYSRDDLFKGRYFDQCPDIQLHPIEGYVPMGGFTFGLKKAFIVPQAAYAGHHSMNGIFVLKELGYESSARFIEGAQLIDIVPTILHLMQVPIPSDLDGKSLADSKQKPPIVDLKDATSPSSERDFEYTKEEEEDLEDRLRSLGYI